MPRSYRENFESLGEFLAAVVEAAAVGAANADRRLEYAAAATGANERVPSEGGFTVPEQFAAGLWQAAYATGQILDRCTQQPITVGDKLSLPAIDETSRADGSRFGGAKMVWIEEGETPAASRPRYQAISLRPKKLLGLSYATSELLEDVPALAAWLERTFASEAAFTIEDSIINGSGVGQPAGVLHSDCLITIDAESGQAPGTIIPDNLTKMAARCWGPSHREAVWLTGNDVFLQIADAHFANGAPIITNGRDGERLVLGMPLLLSEYPPTLGAAGDIILGDFSQYLVAAIAPEFLGSIHVRFVEQEGIFRIRYRVDGQPAWRSPLTPKNSSTSQAPFIAMGPR